MSDPPAAVDPADRDVSRSIGVLGLTFVAIGGVVGSGWLFAPAFAAQLAGPASIIAWTIGGLMILLAALTFAEVSAMFPVVGGLGRLPEFSHGRTVGMFIGWTAWIGYVTAAPIETQALLEYVSNEPQFRWLFDTPGGAGSTMSRLSPGGIAAAIVILIIFTVINAFGVRAFTRINTGLTWFKLAVPLLVVVVLLFNFSPDNLTTNGFAPEGAHGIMAAISSGGIIFAFLGFRHALDLAGEARRPQRTVPIALIASILICIALFTLLQLAFIGALPAGSGLPGPGAGGTNGPIAALLTSLGIIWVANLVLVDAVVGPFGAGLVSTASTARLAVAVSRNGLFPTAIEKISVRRVPLRALAMNATVGAMILFYQDGWQQILTFNTGAIVLSFCMGPITLMALRRQLPDHHRPFRLPVAPLIANLAFIVVGLITYWTGWSTLSKLSLPIGLGVALFAWRLIRHPEGRRELDLGSAIWLPPYFLGVLAISYLGNFGGGREVLADGLDLIVVAVFSLAIFQLAVRCRLADDQVEHYIAETPATELSNSA